MTNRVLAVRVTARYQSAKSVRIDTDSIEKLRKDFLTLAKNISRVGDYKQANTLREAFKVFRARFSRVFFDQFVNKQLKQDESLSETSRAWHERELRKKGWDFYVALEFPMGYPDEYVSAEMHFQRFLDRKKPWEDKIKRDARPFWKALDSFLQEIGREHYDIEVPDVYQTDIEGFKVRIVGDPADRWSGSLELLKDALRIFRQRASQVFPPLVKHMLPLHVYTQSRKLDEGGSYHTRYIDVSLQAAENPRAMAHLVAHEMGHHIYKSYLSDADRKFWDTAIRGDYGALDVERALKLWPDGAWLFEMPQKLKDIDPTLAVQLHVLGYGHGGNKEIQKKEEFVAAVERGETFAVPQHPITGYAGKNSEESFCEALGRLVGYGPRTVDPLIRQWLQLILPSLRVASEERVVNAYSPAENIAINWLIADPDSTLEEILHEARNSTVELWDSVTRKMVSPKEVEQALKKLAPEPLSGGDIHVYHATDASTAKMLLRRGFIPETKPRSTVREYSPGHGLDRGLYVGETPRDVDGYGRAILEVTVPKKYLEVPTEQAQLGVKDPMRALRGHDGAVINHRLPASAFRLLPDRMSSRIAARYKEKKKVKSEDGGTTTVYVYSEKQVEHRNREKAKRVEKLSKSIKKLREKVKKDLKSSEPETLLTALAVALIDHTYERVGNDESAKEGHYGVTGWQRKHVSFGSKGPVIKYVGKSGVKHEKRITDAAIKKALRDAYEAGEGDDANLLSWDGGRITAEKVNSYLEDFDITAKDLRGFHANEEMRTKLRSVRSKGKSLPEGKKERSKQLKEEFKKALEETAKCVGHEASTLKSQYLVPGLEDSYLKDGTVIDKLGTEI